MSTPAEPGAPAPVVDYGARPCPRCGELLAGDQDWCLRCGDPARTVIAPTPRWRRPLLALAALAAIALGVMAAAFVSLTDDDPPPPNVVTTTITTQPGDALPPGVTPAPTGADTGTTGPTGPTGTAGPATVAPPADSGDGSSTAPESELPKTTESP